MTISPYPSLQSKRQPVPGLIAAAYGEGINNSDFTARAVSGGTWSELSAPPIGGHPYILWYNNVNTATGALIFRVNPVTYARKEHMVHTRIRSGGNYSGGGTQSCVGVGTCLRDNGAGVLPDGVYASIRNTGTPQVVIQTVNLGGTLITTVAIATKTVYPGDVLTLHWINSSGSLIDQIAAVYVNGTLVAITAATLLLTYDMQSTDKPGLIGPATGYQNYEWSEWWVTQPQTVIV